MGEPDSTASRVDAELEPFTRRGAVEQARRYLSNSLDFRRFKPGERLPSASDLSTKIGVSRPSVLAALKILEEEGRIEVKPGRAGARVLEPDPETQRARAWEKRGALAEMSLLREIIEPGIVKVAAETGLSADLADEARNLIEKMEHAEDPGDYLGADIEFHHLFGRCLDMKIVEGFAIIARRLVSPGLDIVELTPERLATSSSQHRMILEAVLARKAEVAEAHSLEHVRVSTRLINEALGSLTPPDDVSPRSNERRER
ncbi:MAG TPA: GntR family transcriptional regulator [Acidimicrobiales bacterium]|nr:GntR family transcriptional regulator [Acidimicrobiales bacterium]